ncbi:putative zinc finger (CCCH type) protein [Neospora caninum Liverpool]|uniref:Putative zinc finger (CCCH type) protein n=1 Tax=Neospora caninum (strain Liverpool) TaxID=572307 RepID=F0VCG9_NEOCL|nr:putative zinc finger (CCCH type) protein [Neospora caninum Liverpool]CBZ51291.1 putative zinc finger (CCCH type) protein [Neospora caninum Liverpool]CEL68605.1 TPA: zinc finger (CCCH type) protein, putative [Neospora caninum Liverpool]|eukprot:XP_003881324.1 putative zinc finger (CCCH type) protein [Neospora caninum Liverpool]
MPATRTLDTPNGSAGSRRLREPSPSGGTAAGRKGAEPTKPTPTHKASPPHPENAGERSAPERELAAGKTPAEDGARTGERRCGDANGQAGDLGRIDALEDAGVDSAAEKDDALSSTDTADSGAAGLAPPTPAFVSGAGSRDPEDDTTVPNACRGDRRAAICPGATKDNETLDWERRDEGCAGETDHHGDDGAKDVPLCRAGTADSGTNGGSTQSGRRESDGDQSSGSLTGTTAETMPSRDVSGAYGKEPQASPLTYGEDAVAALLKIHADIRDRLKQDEDRTLTEEAAMRYLGQLASGFWNAQRQLPSFGPGKTDGALEDEDLNKVMMLMHQLDTADTLPEDAPSFSLDAPSPFYESLLATAAYLNDNGPLPQASSLFAFSPPPVALAPPPPAASSYLLSMSLQDCIALPRASVSLLTSLLLQLDVPQLCAPENRLKRALTMQLLQKFLGVHKIGKCIHAAMVSAVNRSSSRSSTDLDSASKSADEPAESAAEAPNPEESSANGRVDTLQTVQQAREEQTRVEALDALSKPEPFDSLTTSFSSARTESPTAEVEDEDGGTVSERWGDSASTGSLSHLLLFSAFEEEAIDLLLFRLLGRVPAGSTAPPPVSAPAFSSCTPFTLSSGNRLSPSSLPSLFTEPISASMGDNAPRLFSATPVAGPVGGPSGAFADRRAASRCPSRAPEGSLGLFHTSGEPTDFSLFFPYNLNRSSSSPPARPEMEAPTTSPEAAVDCEQNRLAVLGGVDLSPVSWSRSQRRQDGAAVRLLGRPFDGEAADPDLDDSGTFQKTGTDSTTLIASEAASPEHVFGVYSPAAAQQWRSLASTPVAAGETDSAATRPVAHLDDADSAAAASVCDKPGSQRNRDTHAISLVQPDREQARFADGGEASERLEETVHLVRGAERSGGASPANAAPNSQLPGGSSRGHAGQSAGVRQHATVSLVEIFGDSRESGGEAASALGTSSSFDTLEDAQELTDTSLGSRAAAAAAPEEANRRRELIVNELLTVLSPRTSQKNGGANKLTSPGTCPRNAQGEGLGPQQETGAPAASDVWQTLQAPLTRDDPDGFLLNGGLGGTARLATARRAPGNKATDHAEAEAVQQKLLFLLGGCQRNGHGTDSAATQALPAGSPAAFNPTHASQQNGKQLWDRSSSVTACVQQQLLRLEAQGLCSASAEGFLRRLRDRMASPGTAGSFTGSQEGGEDLKASVLTPGSAADQEPAASSTELRAGVASETSPRSMSGADSAADASPAGSARAAQKCQGGQTPGLVAPEAARAQGTLAGSWPSQAIRSAEDTPWVVGSSDALSFADEVGACGVAARPGASMPNGSDASGRGSPTHAAHPLEGSRDESSRQLGQQSAGTQDEPSGRNFAPATCSCCSDKGGTDGYGEQCSSCRVTTTSRGSAMGVNTSAAALPFREKEEFACLPFASAGTADSPKGEGKTDSDEGQVLASAPSVPAEAPQGNDGRAASLPAGSPSGSRPVGRGSASWADGGDVARKDAGEGASLSLPETTSSEASHRSAMAEDQPPFLGGTTAERRRSGDEPGVSESGKETAVPNVASCGASSAPSHAEGENTEAKTAEAEGEKGSDGHGSTDVADPLNGLGELSGSSQGDDTGTDGSGKEGGQDSGCMQKASGAAGASPKRAEQDELTGEVGSDAKQEETEELSDASANRLRGELRPACCYFMRSMCEFSSTCVFWHPPASEDPEKIVCKYGRVCHANHGRLVSDSEMASILYGFAKSLASLADGEMGRAIHYLRASRLYGLVTAPRLGAPGASAKGSAPGSSAATMGSNAGSRAGAAPVRGGDLDSGASTPGREGRKEKASGIASSAEAASAGRSGAASRANQEAPESTKNSEASTWSPGAGCRQLPKQVVDRFFGLAERLQGRDLSAVNTAWRQTYGERFPYARYGFDKLSHAVADIPGVTLVLQESNVMVTIDESSLRAKASEAAGDAASPPATCKAKGSTPESMGGSKKASGDVAPREQKSSHAPDVKAEKSVDAWSKSQYSAVVAGTARGGSKASGIGGDTSATCLLGRSAAGNQAKSPTSAGGGAASEEGGEAGETPQGASGRSWGRGRAGGAESKRRAVGRRSVQTTEIGRLPAEELPPLVLKVAREQVVGDLCSSSLLCSACGLLLLSPLVHPLCGHMLCRDCLVILSATHFHSVHRINFKNVSTASPRRHDAPASPSLAQVTLALLHMFPSAASLPLSAQSPSAPSFCPRCTYGEAPATKNALSGPSGASATASLRSGTGPGVCGPQLLPSHAHLPRMLKPQQACPLGEFLSVVASEKGVPALLGRVLSKVRVRCSTGTADKAPGVEAANAGAAQATKVVVDAWGRSREVPAQKPSDPRAGKAGGDSNEEVCAAAALRDALCKEHRVATPSEGCCPWEGDYAGYLEHIKRLGECGRLHRREPRKAQTQGASVSEGGKPAKAARGGDSRFGSGSGRRGGNVHAKLG